MQILTSYFSQTVTEGHSSLAITILTTMIIGGCLRRKKSGKKTGPQHGEDHIDEGRQEGDGDHSLDGHFHPVKFSRAEVVADDGLHAVGKTADRHENQLQNALENRHGTDIEVAPVDLQAMVHHDRDSALRGRHDKGRHAKGHDLADQGEIRLHACLF